MIPLLAAMSLFAYEPSPLEDLWLFANIGMNHGIMEANQFLESLPERRKLAVEEQMSSWKAAISA